MQQKNASNDITCVKKAFIVITSKLEVAVVAMIIRESVLQLQVFCKASASLTAWHGCCRQYRQNTIYIAIWNFLEKTCETMVRYICFTYAVREKNLTDVTPSFFFGF